MSLNTTNCTSTDSLDDSLLGGLIAITILLSLLVILLIAIILQLVYFTTSRQRIQISAALRDSSRVCYSCCYDADCFYCGDDDGSEDDDDFDFDNQGRAKCCRRSGGGSGGFCSCCYCCSCCGDDSKRPERNPLQLEANARDPRRAPCDPRVQISVIFTDVESSHALSELLPTEVEHALQVQSVLIRTAVVRHRAFEAKVIGDGFMICIVSPVAAVKMALDMMRLNDRNGVGSLAVDPQIAQRIKSAYQNEILPASEAAEEIPSQCVEEMEMLDAKAAAAAGMSPEEIAGANRPGYLQPGVMYKRSNNNNNPNNSNNSATPPGDGVPGLSPFKRQQQELHRQRYMNQRAVAEKKYREHFRENHADDVELNAPYHHEAVLRLRIGIDVGSCFIVHQPSSDEFDYLGEPVENAAAIEKLAHGRQLLVSSRVIEACKLMYGGKDLLEHDATFRFIDELTISPSKPPLVVFQVESRGDVEIKFPPLRVARARHSGFYGRKWKSAAVEKFRSFLRGDLRRGVESKKNKNITMQQEEEEEDGKEEEKEKEKKDGNSKNSKKNENKSESKTKNKKKENENDQNDDEEQDDEEEEEEEEEEEVVFSPAEQAAYSSSLMHSQKLQQQGAAGGGGGVDLNSTMVLKNLDPALINTPTTSTTPKNALFSPSSAAAATTPTTTAAAAALAESSKGSVGNFIASETMTFAPGGLDTTQSMCFSSTGGGASLFGNSVSGSNFTNNNSTAQQQQQQFYTQQQAIHFATRFMFTTLSSVPRDMRFKTLQAFLLSWGIKIPASMSTSVAHQQKSLQQQQQQQQQQNNNNNQAGGDNNNSVSSPSPKKKQEKQADDTLKVLTLLSEKVLKVMRAIDRALEKKARMEK